MIGTLFRILLIWSLPLVAAILGIVLAVRTRAYKTIVLWWLRSTALFLLELPMILIGLVFVGLGLRYRRTEAGTEQPFSDPRYSRLGNWSLVRLPKWLLPWDNAFDGLLGDKRGWFANWCMEHKIAYPSNWSMWIWGAIRNPANYWSRVITGCDVTNSTVEVLYGPPEVDESHPGLHLLVLTDAKGRDFPAVNFCYPWPFNPTHGVFARFGWKVKTSHAGTPAGARIQDCVKGTVYRASLWKDLT